MKTLFTIPFIFLSTIGWSQNDTIIYYSKLNKTINSKTDASYYSEIKSDKRGNLSQKIFRFTDEEWKNVNDFSIQRENDTSFSYYSTNNKKEKYLRSFVKTDSGYYLRDYLKSQLISEGYSKTIFPDIRYGQWKIYNLSNGELISEDTYVDNQLITNRYRIPDGSYIKDVFTYVDKTYEYEGGDIMLLKYIAENTNYPESARDNNITGKVVANCVLMKDGSINGINFLRRNHYLLELEAIRVINSIPKNRWKPAEINGQKVNSIVIIPINFIITESFVRH